MYQDPLLVAAIGSQLAWVLPRRRLGGVICSVAVFSLAEIFSFVFCIWYGGDDG